MHSPIDFCASAMVQPYYNELPQDAVWWGEHVDLMENKIVTEGWEGWELYPNDNVGRRPPNHEVENQRPPM